MCEGCPARERGEAAGAKRRERAGHGALRAGAPRGCCERQRRSPQRVPGAATPRYSLNFEAKKTLQRHGSSNTPPGARTRLPKPRHGARGPGRLPAAPPCSSRPPRQTSCRQVQPRRALTKGPRRVMHGAAGSCPVIRYRRPPPRVPSVHLPGRGALLRWPW